MTDLVSDLVARAAPSPAQQAAIAAAIYHFNVELWTLYAFGVAITILRTYARVRSVGWKLQADDYLAWVAIIFYTAQNTLAYKAVVEYHGIANNGMTHAQRAALSFNSPEYYMRVVGSQIQVAGWTMYSCMIATLKLSMLAFYVRLMDGLGRRYRYPIWLGFAFVIGCFIASIITIYAACRPFSKYFQVKPDPGIMCQAAISPAIVWVSFSSNILTDLYLIFIPIPMLWGSQLRLLKKIATTLVLSAGVFVLVCATLKSIFVLVDPLHGAQLAGEWGTREGFAAVVTTNLPMLFQLLRATLNFLFGDRFGSTQNPYQSPSKGFNSYGNGGSGFSRNRRAPPSTDPTTLTLTYNDSEERMVDGMKMHDMKVYTNPVSDRNSNNSTHSNGHGNGNGNGQGLNANGIVVSNQIEVTSESRSIQNGERSPQVASEPW